MRHVGANAAHEARTSHQKEAKDRKIAGLCRAVVLVVGCEDTSHENRYVLASSFGFPDLEFVDIWFDLIYIIKDH